MNNKETTNNQDKTTLMLGYLCISKLPEDTNLRAKINILDRFALTDTEISSICACTKQAVADARHRAKKKKK